MTSGSGPEVAGGALERDVVVLLGGPSAEHDVSVVSGWAIADALAEGGRSVQRIYIDLFDGWWSMPPSASAGRPAPGRFDDPRSLGAEGPMTPAGALEWLAGRDPRPVVFPALHGPFGEDGTIQAMLEAYDLPYAGAGVAASAVGMDKALYKRLVRGLGIKVVDWLEVTAGRWADDRQGVLDELAAFSDRLGERRLMMKPARMGSSVGMTIAHSSAERTTALDEAFRFDSVTIVERYLDHPRELEVAVVGNDPEALEVFGPGEVFPGREFYDYVAKYGDGVSKTTPSADARRSPGPANTRHGYGGVPGHRLRGLRPRRFPAVRGRALSQRAQHNPRLHADKPVPADGGNRVGRVRRGLPADRGSCRAAARRTRPAPADRGRPPTLN